MSSSVPVSTSIPRNVLPNILYRKHPQPEEYTARRRRFHVVYLSEQNLRENVGSNAEKSEFKLFADIIYIDRITLHNLGKEMSRRSNSIT